MAISQGLDAEALTATHVRAFGEDLSGVSGELVLDLTPFDSALPQALNALRDLADRADALLVNIVLMLESAALQAQLDCERLHRRFSIRRADEPDLQEQADDVYSSDDHDVQAWRADVPDLLDRLEREDLQTAALQLRWIVSNEERLYAENKIEPYRDLIPKLVEQLDTERLAQLLAHQEAPVAARILLDDYTRVADRRIATVLQALPSDKAAQVVDAMVVGVDRPVRVAPILCAMEDSGLAHLLEASSARVLRRIVDSALQRDQAEHIVCRSPIARVAELLRDVCDSKGETSHGQACAIFRVLDGKSRSEVKTQLDSQTKALIEGGPYPGEDDLRSLQWCGPAEINRFVTGTGDRISYPTAAGRVVQINEAIDFEHGRKNIRVDLVEIEPGKSRFSCYIGEGERLAYHAFQRLFAPFDEGGSPDESSFRAAGMFRLADVAQSKQAIAGINGNFYFDYGHYIYGRELGLDLSKPPGLRFGDPVGWFVAQGRELAPPIFNRCTFIVTGDGRTHIRRVRMTGVVIRGQKIGWHADNRRCHRREIGFYTSVSGFRSLEQPLHTDFSVVNGKIAGIKRGGDTIIPFTGFVLSFPNTHPLLRKLRVGDSVKVLNDFGREDVVEAMASGPQLVKDGQIEVDFRVEEFGQKDSSVMSFFLPRLFESYEAARSFIGQRNDGTVVLGTVSGRAFGSGPNSDSAGMTFGELAQLALDLGLENAMGLDGGGSSSVVVETEGVPTVLNVPTGGADVPRGHERFISTALLVLPGQPS